MTGGTWYCSVCGKEAYYDGRCGDGPVLVCGCNKGEWVNEGNRGGYYTNPTGAKPVETRSTQITRTVRITTTRTKCACNLTARDVPPGLDPEDVALECEEDPQCPKRRKKRRG